MNTYGKGVGVVAAPITGRSDSGGFTAIASTASVDRDHESIAPHAFDPLPNFVPCHVNHSMTVESVIGKAHPYYRGNTLMVDVTFGSSETAQSVRRQILDGLINSVSVAFTAATRKTIDKVVTITSGELLSIDVVSIPSQRDARILSTRSYRPGHTAITQTRQAALDAMLSMARAEIAEARRAVNAKSPQPGPAARELRRFLRSL